MSEPVPAGVLRCPIHQIPDCSPLLNGCSLPTRLAAAYRQGAEQGWNQGMRTGVSRAMRHMSDEPDLPLPTEADNPHRTVTSAAEKMAEGPEAGHTWRIVYESRGSTSVTGEEGGPRDAPEFSGIRHGVEVRAWNLRDALRKAAELPFGELMGEDAERCRCGNRFDGDNLCMRSACQWER